MDNELDFTKYKIDLEKMKTEKFGGKYVEDEDICLVKIKVLYAEALNKAGFDFSAVIRNFADRNQMKPAIHKENSHIKQKAFGVKANYIKFRLEPEKSDLAYEEKYQQQNMEDLPFWNT